MKLSNVLILLALALAVMALGFFFGKPRNKAVPFPAPAAISVPATPSVTLPPPPELLKICRAIAALDLILSAEWEDRFYSFDSKWGTGEQMASMRDAGDGWHVVFSDKGWTALRGFAHESPASGPYVRRSSKALPKSQPSIGRIPPSAIFIRAEKAHGRGPTI
jgi:hypothetical protein